MIISSFSFIHSFQIPTVSLHISICQKFIHFWIMPKRQWNALKRDWQSIRNQPNSGLIKHGFIIIMTLRASRRPMKPHSDWNPTILKTISNWLTYVAGKMTAKALKSIMRGFYSIIPHAPWALRRYITHYNKFPLYNEII